MAVLNETEKRNIIEKITAAVDSGSVSVAVVSACGDTDTENGHTILPLVLLTERSPELFAGGFVADKVIGKGAASLLVCAGASEVHGTLMSEAGRRMLEEHGITASWATLCDTIINHRGDGMCPVEALVRDIEDPEECRAAVLGFAEKLK